MCRQIQQAATKENYNTILAKLLEQHIKEYDLTLRKEMDQNIQTEQVLSGVS